jgi:hypothetical protein
MRAPDDLLTVIEWANGLVSNGQDLIERNQSSGFRLFSGF